MRTLLTILVLLASAPAAWAIGTVTGPECTFNWTHDPTTVDVVEGSKVHVADNGTLANEIVVDVGNVTTATCTQVGLAQNGQYYAAVSAYNRAGDSGVSNIVPFVLIRTAPNPPASISIQ
jgi:hypothetical protein